MKKILPILILIFFALAYQADAATPIKILLLPGHDNMNFGAQFGNVKEADMNLAVATKIYNLLKKDPRFEVHITRNSTGYTKEFADYLEKNRADIIAYEKNAKNNFRAQMANGGFITKVNPPHHNVSEDLALRLYGYNMWAVENNMDAMIHIHFNDYPRPMKWTIGMYKGFTIYIPDNQFPNYRISANLAKSIFTQLRTKYSTSTFPPEIGGLITDQKLIAIGANGTLDATVRSVLIEYSYIYEKILRTKSTRLQAYTNMANLTTAGIKKYFFPK